MSDTESWATPAESVTALVSSPTRAAEATLQPKATAEPQAPLGPGVQQIEPSVPCKCGSERNLVVCIDGTSNQFSTKNTNVVELYSRLVKDKSQLTFYNSGIGTYAKPSWKSWEYRKQVIANTLDLAFALRFEKIIISAYAWLVDNYHAGDRIFLFGFSRGAYQVRALAAMIDIVGLLHKGNDNQIPFAYELYAAYNDDERYASEEGPPRVQKDIRPLHEKIAQAWHDLRSKGDGNNVPSFPWPKVPVQTAAETPQSPKSNPKMQEQFKKTFSRTGVRVHFVGAWDTVSSVGFIREKTLPATTDGMKSVCFFRHALALHEFRVKFLPEYVNGGAGPSVGSASGDVPHTKEVWFTGSHSDIGGGSTINTSLDKFGPALRWMSLEAALAGLRFMETPANSVPVGASQSMTFIWRIVDCLPIKRLVYPTYKPDHPPRSQSFTWLPHLLARRQIQPLQRIHQSVYEECYSFQNPAGLMLEGEAFLILRPAAEVLHRGWILNDQTMLILMQLTSSKVGIRSLDILKISKYIYQLALAGQTRTDQTGTIMTDLRSLWVAYVKGSFKVDLQIDLAQDSDVTETTSLTTFPFNMCGHTQIVCSVAFLSDTRVVSGSYDNTLRTWDVSTGEMTLGSPLSGHTDEVNCVAVHAAQSIVASASDDGTIHLWTSDSNGAVHAGKVLQGRRSGQVLAVAFSPDGSHLVSGSMDGAIRVWNAATGEQVGEPVHGHTSTVWSVAFSLDGKRVVSGSRDFTVRVWEWSPDEATLHPCGEPLSGHPGTVISVAFSPEARVIASGSRDNTVRLWDADARTSKFTLRGHTDAVNSVAFAPSGTHLVSGSGDWTVRIWDARTGAAVRVLRGHTDMVFSVAFSPDGTRIASGSRDKTVRVWDFDPTPNESRHDEDVRAEPGRVVAVSQKRPSSGPGRLAMINAWLV